MYLNEGINPVTMTVGQGATAHVTKNRVQVHQHWGWQTRKDIDDISAYVAEIARYDVDKLDGPSCVRLMGVAAESGSVEFLKRMGLSVVGRAASVDAGDVAAATGKLREALGIEKLATDDSIANAYAEAFKTASHKAKAALAAELADVLDERGAFKEAFVFPKAALAGDFDKDTSRRLFVACGNAARYAGDAAAARAAFAAADEVKLDRSAVERTAVGGGLALKAEDTSSTANTPTP